MNFLAFSNSILGLLTGILTLILGILKLLPDIRAFTNRIARKEIVSVEHIRKAKVLSRVIGIALILVAASLFSGRILGQNQMPLNSYLTVQAWKALDGRQYSRAIAFADSCIREFGGLAEFDQAKLDSLHVPPPPTGSVDEDTKAAIVNRGLLNDVATCFFIKGKALEQSGRIEEACEAYKAATRFSHARCWDPRGWFWSPAEASAARLRHMRC